MAGKLHVGDTSTIELEIYDEGVAVDLTGATTTRIVAKRPDGTLTAWTGTISPTESYVLRYTLSASDLDMDGVWEFQAELTLSGWAGHSTRQRVQVDPVLTA